MKAETLKKKNGDSSSAKSQIEMVELNLKIYGKILWGVLIGVFLVYLFALGVEPEDIDVGFYVMVGFMSIGGLMLVMQGLTKISNSDERSRLSVNAERIFYYDSDSQDSHRYEWKHIKTVEIKYNSTRNNYAVYLSVRYKNSTVKELDISYLRDRRTGTIQLSDITRLLKLQKPEFTELDKTINMYLSRKR